MAETSSFEDEILALNPEYDLVFSKYNENPRSDSPNALEPSTRWSSPHRMKIISKMNEIVNAKPIGELPTQHDWDDQQSAEIETITLMRKLGLEQSVDRAPDEKRTISTVPTSEDVIFMKNGRKKMSIFMADAYFELKPRSEPSFDFDDENAAPEESTISDFSDDVNLYQPIFESSQETESTSLSEDPEEKSRSGVAYNRLDQGVSSDSSRLKSIESQRKSIESQPKSIESQRKSIESQRKSIDSQRKSIDSQRKSIDSQRKSIDSQRKSIDSQRKSVDHQYVDSCRSYTRDGSKRFSDSGSKSSSSRSSRSWRSLNGSFSDVRDENNWRLNVSKDKEPVKQKPDKINEQTILNRTVTLNKETLKPTDEPSKPAEVSSCGRALYKPKDLFMKKKAMMITQVLAEYQS